MKKCVAAVLTAAMILGLAGCSGSGAANTETSTEKVTTESSSDATEEVDQAYTKGINFIENGDFTEGVGKWTTYFNSGGNAKLSQTEDERLDVDIQKVGGVDYGVQIYYDGFKLRKGGVYKVQFDVSSDIERTIEWRVQINGGDYHLYAGDHIKVGPEVKHVEAEFTMEEDSDPAPRMVFNMGCQEGMTKETQAHHIYYDNIDLEVIDDTNMIQDPEPVAVPCAKVNQIGYNKNDTKSVVFSDLDREKTKTFEVVNVKNGKTVYTGEISEGRINAATQGWCYYGDFSSLKKKGTYKVVCGEGESFEFTIGKKIYDDVLQDTLKMLYMQRCGNELTEEYAGEFAHPACHTEMATVYGTTNQIDVSGGWHDAGDYGRYVVSGAKAVADLLLAYQQNPKAFNDKSGIPESRNKVPDILDEARYELTWMLKMQNAEGGVYHKVTCANFPETVLPQEETEELIVCPVSITATGDFAAVMAMAYESYKDIDEEFANTCLAASKKAWTYMQGQESSYGFSNPEEVVTGEYPDGITKDEYYWAACELYRQTGEQTYFDYIKNTAEENNISKGEGWKSVGSYGTIAYMTMKDAATIDADLYEKMLKALTMEADKFVETANTDGYYYALGRDYAWGSNMDAADAGMLLSFAYQITGEESYKEIERREMDYLMGTNATGYCFITGYGSLSPENTHHRPSQVLGTTMKGMLVGGPDDDLEDPYAKAVLCDKPAAMCYADNAQCFSCNEVTVYWNSPLVYLIADEK